MCWWMLRKMKWVFIEKDFGVQECRRFDPFEQFVRLSLWIFFIYLFILQSSNFNNFCFFILFYFVRFVNHSWFQPITAKDEFSFSVETVLPSHGFQPTGVYHVGLFDRLLHFVNVACGPREVKPSCVFLKLKK